MEPEETAIESLIAILVRNRLQILAAVGAMIAALVGSSYLIGLDTGITTALIAATTVVTLGAYRVLSKAPVKWDDPLRWSRLATSALLGLLVVGLAIQAIPYGRDHTNPAITSEPSWDSPRTRELTVRACFDCHSNEVGHPWYSRIAPISWAVQSHIDSGRSEVNYSEWDRPQNEADESAETVIDGEMPPAYFTRFTHSDARLDDAERQQLIDGLLATFGGESGDEHDRERDEKDDDD